MGIYPVKNENGEEEFVAVGYERYETVRCDGVRYVLGVPVKTFRVEEFTYGCGCNVYDWRVVSTAIHNELGKTFSLEHLEHDGRDHEWTINVTGHRLRLKSSGYGSGDNITFDDGFPEDWMFTILKYMARDHACDMANYYEEKSGENDRARQAHRNFCAMEQSIYKEVNNLQDLLTLTEYAWALDKKEWCTHHLAEGNLPSDDDKFFSSLSKNNTERSLAECEDTIEQLAHHPACLAYQQERNKDGE